MATMHNTVILVTGATDGIGLETARQLAATGATVIVHGRNAARTKAALRDIEQSTSNPNLLAANADFASLSDVRAMVNALGSMVDRLDALINNAGIYPTRREVTRDGFERTLAVDQLAPFLLTNLLLPLLRRSAPSRIITVTSMVHQSTGIDFDNLQSERHFTPYGAYAVSKLGNILFTYKLARDLTGTGVTANCLHPGVVNTKLLRAGFGPGGSTSAEAANALVHLATSPDLAGTTGTYFIRGVPSRSAPNTYDTELQERFWRVCEELTGLQKKREQK